MFLNDEKIVNSPKGSDQYKSYNSLKPIDIIKAKYKDYK